MNTDDIIHDGKGKTYRIGPSLGRGLYAKSYLIGGENQKEWVLKVPLSPVDLPTSHQELAKISRQILQEQWETLHKIKHPNLCVPVSQFISDKGIYCLLYKRQNPNLSSELRQRDFGIHELLEIALNITKSLRQLPSNLFPHGAIHPQNIFRTTRDSIIFMDPLPKLALEHYRTFKQSWTGSSFSPPELLGSNPEKLVVTDTYSIAMMLYIALLSPNSRQIQEIENRGINFSTQGTLEKSIETMLKRDTSSNVHFHSSFVRQFSLFLKRALNPKTKPSPPFRFTKIVDFQNRLEELLALLNPSIKKVNRIIFSMDRISGVPNHHDFYTSEPVDFRCSITTAPSIEDNDYKYITCGIKLYNIDNVEDLQSEDDFSQNSRKYRDYNCTKTELERQHANRFQFKIQLEDIVPGNYFLDLGFKIEGSLSPLRSQQAFFQVIPEPGYHPPPKEEESSSEDRVFPPELVVLGDELPSDENFLDGDSTPEDYSSFQDESVNNDAFNRGNKSKNRAAHRNEHRDERGIRIPNRYSSVPDSPSLEASLEEDRSEGTTEIATNPVIEDYIKLPKPEKESPPPRKRNTPTIRLSNPDDYRSPIKAEISDIDNPIPDKNVPPRVQEVAPPPKTTPFQEASINGSPFSISIETLEESSEEEIVPEVIIEPEESEEISLEPISEEIIDDSIGTLIKRTIQWLSEDSFRMGLAGMGFIAFLLFILLIWLSQ